MIFLRKLSMTPQEHAQLENAIALETINASNIEYLSMMAGIDLDDEDESLDEVEE